MPIAHLYAQLQMYAQLQKSAPADLKLPVSIQRWYELYKDQPAAENWYVGWLLRGLSAPDHVTIPTREALERFSRVWDCVALCQRAGVDGQTYYAWFKGGTIQNAEWLRWLYGDSTPSDCFVADAVMHRLKQTGTETALGKEAKVSPATVRLWRRNELLREALERTIVKASSSGGHLPQAKDWAPWQGIDSRTRRLRGQHAAALTWSARCKQAGIPLASYHQAMGLAERLGVKEHLHNYLNDYDPRTFKKTGLIAERFFVPSPGMLDFRREARQAASAQGLIAFKKLREHAAFIQWFIDWTAPREWSGKQSDPVFHANEIEAAGTIELPTVSDGSVAPTTPALDDEKQNDSARGADQSQQPTRSRRLGRKRNTQTAEVYRFCYEATAAGKKTALIKRLADAKFGAGAVSEAQYIPIFAKRYAETEEKPWPLGGIGNFAAE